VGDLSSLELLEYLLCTAEMDNLVAILSYRSNEIPEDHPLMPFIERTRSCAGESGRFRAIELGGLDEASVVQIVADASHRSLSESRELGEYLYAKARGNPYFTFRVLESLHDRGIVRYDGSRGFWDWDMDAVRNSPIGDTIIDCLVQGFSSLAEDVLSVLKIASCAGVRFDLATLYAVVPRSIDVPASLWTLIERGFIVPATSDCRLMDMERSAFLSSRTVIEFAFQHDRVQQAAYGLVSPQDRERLHLEIGNALVGSSEPGQIPAHRLFAMANHFNSALSLVDREPLLSKVYALNVEAGFRAKQITAYESARDYLEIAISLSDSGCGDDLFSLYAEYAETLFLCGRAEESLRVLASVLSRELAVNERARVYALRAKILDHAGKPGDMILSEIRTALALFSITLPSTPEEAEPIIQSGTKGLRETVASIMERGPSGLARMEREEDILAMNILMQSLPVAYQNAPWLYTVIQFKMLDMTYTRGFTEASCKNLMECAITIGPTLRDYAGAYRLAQFVFSLIEARGIESQRSPCSFIFATFVSHWIKHYRESVEHFDRAINAGLVCGDIQHVAYSCAHRFATLLSAGTDLRVCSVELAKALSLLKANGAALLMLYGEMFEYALARLTDRASYETGNDLRERVFSAENLFYKYTFAQLEVMIATALGDYGRAREWLDYSAPFYQTSTGHFPIADHYVYEVLTLRWECDDADGMRGPGEAAVDATRALARMEELCSLLDEWARNCPDNFEHKRLLARACLSMVRGDSLETILAGLNASLAAIPADSFLHMKAIIHDLSADFWLARGQETIGKAFVREAWYQAKTWALGVSSTGSRPDIRAYRRAPNGVPEPDGRGDRGDAAIAAIAGIAQRPPSRSSLQASGFPRSPASSAFMSRPLTRSSSRRARNGGRYSFPATGRKSFPSRP
jgi:predicted ATPase